MKNSRTTHPKILIVEDTEIIMYLVKAYINKTMPDSSIVEANNGAKGIDMYKIHNPDIIILNIQLPEKNGYTVAKEIRIHEANNNILCKPIIALTARDIKGEKEKCLNAGMNDFLAKPVDKDSLAQMLNKYLSPAETKDKDKLIKKHALKKTHFDKQGFINRLDGNIQQYNELIYMAIPHLHEYMLNLENAVINKDFDDIEQRAHKLKGAALFLGFNKLSNIAEKIEYDKESDIEKTKKQLENLQKEFGVVKKILNNEREN